MKREAIDTYIKYMLIRDAQGVEAAEEWINKQPAPWKEGRPSDRIHVCTDAEKYDYFNRLAEGDEE